MHVDVFFEKSIPRPHNKKYVLRLKKNEAEQQKSSSWRKNGCIM
jgi:hypothetical protein